MSSVTPRILTRTVRVGQWAQYSWPPPDDWLYRCDDRYCAGHDHDVVVRYEKLSDEKGKGKVNHCEHLMFTCDNPTFSVEIDDAIGVGVNPQRWEVAIAYDPRSDIPAALNSFWNPYGVDWDSVVQRVIPSMRSEFNLLNFAWEAGEIRDLFDTVVNGLRDPGSLLPVYRSVGSNQRIGRHVALGQLSGQYLEATFGFIPLVSDIRALWNQMETFGERLGANRARLRRGVKAVQVIPASLNYSKPLTVQGTTGSYSAQLDIRGTVTTTASCRVTGSIPSSPVREYLDYIGFYPDLSTLWNAVPFSFLVDYIAPIGDALEGSSWIQPNLATSNGCYSLKAEGSWTVRIKDILNSGYVYNPSSLESLRTLAINGRFSYYRRAPVDPVLDGVDLDPVSFPSLRQSLNIAALVTNGLARR